MSFRDQVIATLIGTFGGFLGSLVLFWIKQFIEEKRKEKALLKNLIYEIDYNINLFTNYDVQLTKCIEAIGADSKETYLNLDYTFIGRHHAIQFYREGLITKFLHPEDMKRWNDFLSALGEGSETYVKECVEKWRTTQIEKEMVFKALKHERSQIQYAKEFSQYLKTKIKP